MTITTAWKSGGVDHSITTTRNENEPVDDFLARHQEAVDAAQVIWKPD